MPDVIYIALLDQDDVAVVVGVVGFTRRCVFGDEPVDEVLDGGICGMVFGELAEVFGGFESDHECPPRELADTAVGGVN